MPVERPDPFLPPAVARATEADARAGARLADEAHDLLLPDAARLHDRLRAALNGRLRAVVGALERELRLGAARRLSAMGAGEAAEMLLARTDAALQCLRRTALLRDPALVAELIGSTRLVLLAEALPSGASAGTDRPSLVVRLAECPEPDVARAAADLLAITNAGLDAGFPDPIRARLIWAVAATLRRGLGEEPRADHALADAASTLVAEAPGETVDSASTRLATAIAARPDELAGLLVETLGDRRPALFAALLAVASALSFADARAIVSDPDGARLWLLLRAQGLGRPVIARIGVALAAADSARDLERFADELDEVMAVSPEVAAATFAPLALPHEYRDALAVLGDRA